MLGSGNRLRQAEAPLRHLEHRLTSPDGRTQLTVSQHGSQATSLWQDGHEILVPLDEGLRGIKIDPNEPRIVGKTSHTGGSYPAFPFGKRLARAFEWPTHGAAGNAGTTWGRDDESSDLPYALAMQTGGEGTTILDRSFPDRQHYGLARTFAVAGNHPYPTTSITTTIRSLNQENVVAPPFAEHAHFRSGPDSALATMYGIKPVTKWIEAGWSGPEDGNVIDEDLDPAALDRPGRLIFLPDGPTGHAITVSAICILPNGKLISASGFHIYRAKPDDQYTAFEPFVRGVSLQGGEYLKFDFTVTTYPSLDALNAYDDGRC